MNFYKHFDKLPVRLVKFIFIFTNIHFYILANILLTFGHFDNVAVTVTKHLITLTHLQSIFLCLQTSIFIYSQTCAFVNIWSLRKYGSQICQIIFLFSQTSILYTCKHSFVNIQSLDNVAARFVKLFFILTNIHFHILANILLFMGMPCSCKGAFLWRIVGYRCWQV